MPVRNSYAALTENEEASPTPPTTKNLMNPPKENEYPVLNREPQKAPPKMPRFTEPKKDDGYDDGFAQALREHEIKMRSKLTCRTGNIMTSHERARHDSDSRHDTTSHEGARHDVTVTCQPCLSILTEKQTVVYAHAVAGRKGLPNSGEQHFNLKTEDGIRLAVVFQNADVEKPLFSVAKITDSGAEVIFRRTGGEIRHLNGIVVSFLGENNTYRIETEVVVEKHPIEARPE
jgi:hypothetical protein